MRRVIMYAKSKNVVEVVDGESGCKLKVHKEQEPLSYTIHCFTPWSGLDHIPDNADQIVREAMGRMRNYTQAEAPKAIAEAVEVAVRDTLKGIDQAEPKGSYILNCEIEKVVAKGKQPREKKSRESPSLLERAISYLREIYGGEVTPLVKY